MSLNRYLARFIVVGFLNTIFGYSVFLTLLLAGYAGPVALLVATGAGFVWNYFSYSKGLQGALSFVSVFRYILTFIIIYVTNVSAFNLLRTVIRHDWLAQMICLPLVALLTAVLFRLWVFPVSTRAVTSSVNESTQT